MLTARRMRERQEAAVGGPPPPRRPRPQDIPWSDHEAALSALETRLRAELAAVPSAHMVELSLDDEPFKSEVAKLVADFEARFKEALEEGAAKLSELEQLNKLLGEQLEQVTAEKAAALKELLEWQAAADVPTAKAEVAAAEAPVAATEAPAATAPDPSSAQPQGKKPSGNKPK